MQRRAGRCVGVRDGEIVEDTRLGNSVDSGQKIQKYKIGGEGQVSKKEPRGFLSL